MRTTANEYKAGRLWSGYDYKVQAYVIDGKYMNCGHPSNTCDCYGRAHAGEETVVGQDHADGAKVGAR